MSFRGESSSSILTVSVTRADALARRIEHLTDVEVAVFRGRRQPASTLPDAARVEPPPPGVSADIDAGGREYRGRLIRFNGAAGAPVDLAILRPSAPFSEHIADNRLLIAGLLVLFVLLALAAATYVSRALTGQIATLLAAARRLPARRLPPARPGGTQRRVRRARAGVQRRVGELEAKIEEVERKRQELEQTIRRVGDALATGLDRHGLVALAVRQAVDACGAEAGGALPLARGIRALRGGQALSEELERAIEVAERCA